MSLLVSGVLFGAAPSVLDTDGFMRLTRVTELRLGAVGWWDGFAYRSNAPFGHSMHWTRPLDVLLLMLALPLETVAAPATALRYAAFVIGPLGLGLLAASTTWAFLPLLGKVGALVAGLGVAIQPALLAYGSVGRVDHHSLIFIAAAVLVGLSLRLVDRPTETRLAVSAGVVAGLGLWVSTEFLLPTAVVLLAFCVAWVIGGEPAPRAMQRLCAAWVVTVLVALMIERAPDLRSQDLDRISLVHFVVAVLAFAFWRMLPLVALAKLGRFGQALGAGAVAGLLLWFAVPSFVAGPFGDVPPELWGAWLSKVAELQPIWPFADNPTRAVYLLAGPLIGLLLVLAAVRTDAARRGRWVILAVALVGFIVMGTVQTRFVAYAQMLASVGWGWLAATLVARVGSTRSVKTSLRRVGAMLVGVAGFLVPVVAVTLLPAEASQPGVAESCELRDLVGVIDSRGDAPIVLAHVDWGPEILYRTDAQVLAAPYHRNVGGILDARAFLSGSVEHAARIAEERGVDLVAVCLERDAAYLGDDRSPGDLLSAIATGEEPAWLSLISASGGLKVYEVDRDLTP